MKYFFKKLKYVQIRDIGHVFIALLVWIPAIIYKRGHPHLWLICDSSMEARDNGYWLFRYIREHHKEQEVIYAIDNKSVDYKKVSKLGKTVNYGSVVHWFYYLSAEKNISSQKGGKPNAAVCHLLEVSGFLNNTRIFLQHGITMNDVEFLHYKNTRMRLFLCSTKRELDYITANFEYPSGWVRKLGMPRFDQLYDFEIKSGQILVMPTWRNWIGTASLTKKRKNEISEFCKTEYFQKWYLFLQSKELSIILEQYKLELIFYLHRDTQRFSTVFQTENPRIHIASWTAYDVQDLLKESEFLITDYSSVSMDFAYMKKPLLYYQFDIEKFQKNHYSKGYFSYEKDGFGPVCYHRKDLLDVLREAAENKFKNKKIYLERHSQFFDLYDKNNSKRTYEAILRLAKE